MLFFAAGILLLLDKGLMAVGNLLFLTGITLLIGPNRIVGFFFRQDRINSTVCFFGGIVLVLIKWPFVGLILESVGIFNLL
ncbi:hypothetical protein PhCBS80983_g02081 [Powellomyces hirtus]|uniref:Vesicle transport protein n=1 Tax=Powellomyces hirtus TaxID=109895 RepID=A0A507E8D0_9FUNG|nr:hypothetical protein PhCBS80983_g02081 [Powellomyces hirtus]